MKTVKIILAILTLIMLFFIAKSGFSQTLEEYKKEMDSISKNLCLDNMVEPISIANLTSVGAVGTFSPTNSMTFGGDSTSFTLTFNGDSLVWSGDMKLTESAKCFIDFCDDYFYSKIDSLQVKLYNCIQNKNK